MKKALYPLLIGLLFFIFPQTNFATHIVGGEMNYRCLGNDMYEIELTIFRDCDTGVPDFDYPASIGIYSLDPGTNTFALQTFITDTLILTNEILLNLNTTLAQIGSSTILPNPFGPDTLVTFGHLIIPYINNDTLNPQLSNPCLVVPPNVCVNTTTYRDTVMLPFMQGGYTLNYQRCCRNGSILNIVDPLGTGATYPAVISETALMECNSNAVFNDWPPIYICVNEPIDFDHAATDIDGDSLVYSLCVPYSGATPDAPRPQPPVGPPFNEVVWQDPPFDLTNIMGGVPLAIDSETGFLTGIPNTIGQFVVGICVEEYRNGVLISRTRRDFQYNVGVCGDYLASFFVPEVSCEGLEVTFDNQSVNAVDYHWEFNDPGNPGQTSTLQNPVFIYGDTGTYTTMLAVSALVDTTLCADTTFNTFAVYEASLFPEFEYDFVACQDTFELGINNMSSDTVFALTGFEWFVDGTPYSNSQMPPNLLGQISDFPLTVSLVITNEKGCTDTTEQIINTGIELDYDDVSIFCERLNSISLLVDVLNMPDTFAFEWMPSAGIISGGDTNMPLVDLTVDSIYHFTVTYDDGCIVQDSIIIMNGNDNLSVVATATPDTIFDGNSSQLEVFGNNLNTYNWSPPFTLDDATIFNPLATPETTTEYSVLVTDENGCVDSAAVLVVVIDLICEEPYLFMPNAFTPNDDGANDVLYVEGSLIDEMYLAIYNRWGEKVFESNDKSKGWDGKYKDELLEPDVYGYYLTIKCLNGEEFFKKGNINLIR